MNQDLSIPARLIAERMGLSFPKERWPDLAKGIAKAGTSLGFDDPMEFIADLASGSFGQREIQALACHLTVPETHFFRSPETFAALQDRILPELIAAQQSTTRRLRIWSAGCATGPEPFSLAILVSRLLPRMDHWEVSILATDINPDGFSAASAAEYTQWSFRGTPSWVVNGYFTKTRDGRHHLSPAIRDMVAFRYLNLVEDDYPTDCDLILCRNVMMYFSRETAVRVADKLRRSLREGGYLLVTASETSRDVQGPLTSLTMQGEIVYKKTPMEAPQMTAPAPPEPVMPKIKNRPRSARGTSKQACPPHSHPVKMRPQRGNLRLERRAYSREEPPLKSDTGRVDNREMAREARLLADRGHLEQALERCGVAMEAEKLNPSLYYLKASILQELGRAEEAEQALQSTLFLDGEFALARVMLGAIARTQSRAQDAAKHFREALALLEQMPADSVLAESNGLTAGEMVETVASLIESERVS